MTEEPAPRRDRRIALLLWLLPLWLVASGAFGIWYYFRKQAADEQVEQIRFATSVSMQGLQNDVNNLLGFVGERHTGAPRGLDRAASMIDGSLGPSNAGYKIEKLRAPETPGGRWPVLISTLRGEDAKLPPVWVLAGYDSRPGSSGAEANATGVASVLSAAHALAVAKPKRSVVFAFIPHAYDPESPLLETVGILRKRIGVASELLVVESTGAAEKLMVSSRDAENRVPRSVGELGEVVGAESICLEEDFDLSSVLFEAGLPAVRVSTRPVVKGEEADGSAPDPAKHAAATKALVTLIGKLSDS